MDLAVMCTGVQHIPFSSTTTLMFTDAKIKAHLLFLILNKTLELEAFGLKALEGNSLTIEGSYFFDSDLYHS